MAKVDRHTEIFEAFEEYAPLDSALSERNLMRAMILGALADLNKQGDVGRKAREFFLNADPDYLFSFQSICNFLEIDPRSIMVVTGLARTEGAQTMVSRAAAQRANVNAKARAGQRERTAK